MSLLNNQEIRRIHVAVSAPMLPDGAAPWLRDDDYRFLMEQIVPLKPWKRERIHEEATEPIARKYIAGIEKAIRAEYPGADLILITLCSGLPETDVHIFTKARNNKMVWARDGQHEEQIARLAESVCWEDLDYETERDWASTYLRQQYDLLAGQSSTELPPEHRGKRAYGGPTEGKLGLTDAVKPMFVKAFQKPLDVVIGGFHVVFRKENDDQLALFVDNQFDPGCIDDWRGINPETPIVAEFLMFYLSQPIGPTVIAKNSKKQIRASFAAWCERRGVFVGTTYLEIVGIEKNSNTSHQCTAFNRAGHRCSNRVTGESMLCSRHQGDDVLTMWNCEFGS